MTAGPGAVVAPQRFEVPTTLAATEPPEARGLARDGVRLLVASPSGIRHTRFAALADHLEPGDMVVVNDSATLPAAVDGHRVGAAVTVHFSTGLDDGSWVVELRRTGRTGPDRGAVAGERVSLPGGASLTLLAGHPHGGVTSERLWTTSVDVPTNDPVPRLLAAHGRPITYGYVPNRWPLSAYQTVFAESAGAAGAARADSAGTGDVPAGGPAFGSAEMPSAGRPFTAELVTRLVSRGIAVAPITLHTGVSSLDKHEPPLAEPYSVPAATARLVNLTRSAGGRVVAVGTTVTRALETVAGDDGTVSPGSGRTELVLGPDRPARVVDGLVTGWHEPGASHLLLLDAVAGRDLVDRAYREAVRERYRWHEFGDSCLLLPPRSAR